MERKRKRPNFTEERLYKKFEVLESRLLQLYTDNGDDNDIESINASVTDIVSLVDGQTERDEDEDEIQSYNNENFEDNENYNEDDDQDPHYDENFEENFEDQDYNDYEENHNEENPAEESRPENPAVEEVDLSDDDISNIWENSSRPVPAASVDEDVVFLNEEATKSNDLSSYACPSLHPDIRETWTVWTRNGISLKNRKELLQKYMPPKFLKTPEINKEIAVTLHKRPIEKDDFIRTSQEMVSSALTVLGSVMSSLLTETDYDKLKVLNSLNDTAKLLTDLFHFDTDKRRSNIISWKPQPVQNLLMGTKPDEFLFGKNLLGKINQAQKVGRIGKLKPYVFKRTNNRPYKYFPSPYRWCGNEEEEQDDKDFVLNPNNTLKKEQKDAKFICKVEKLDDSTRIKLE